MGNSVKSVFTYVVCKTNDEGYPDEILKGPETVLSTSEGRVRMQATAEIAREFEDLDMDDVQIQVRAFQ